jgi:hypothetical protein
MFGFNARKSVTPSQFPSSAQSLAQSSAELPLQLPSPFSAIMLTPPFLPPLDLPNGSKIILGWMMSVFYCDNGCSDSMSFFFPFFYV